METLTRKDFKKLHDFPTSRFEVKVGKEYSFEQFAKIVRGCKSQSMDERWNIFFETDYLNFYRSWSGNCIFMAKFEHLDKNVVMTTLLINGDEKQYKRLNKKDDVQTVCEVIDQLLLK